MERVFPANGNVSVNLDFMQDGKISAKAPADVTAVKITITAQSEVMSALFNTTDNSAIISDVPAGSATIKVEGMGADNSPRYSAQQVITINAGKTTSVSLQMIRIGNLNINNGAISTSNVNVTLMITRYDGSMTKMIISNVSGDYSGSTWVPFAATHSWILATVPPGDSATVYVKLSDDSGNETSEFSDSIVFSSSLPVTNVTSPVPDGSYKSGSPDIDIVVEFSELVLVTGTPQLQLAGGVGNIPYTSGSGTLALTFRYVIDPAHNTPDLAYVGTDSLVLNGGTVQDNFGNAILLTLPAPGGPGSLDFNKAISIDNLIPTVTGVTSPTLDGTYQFGSPDIDINVTFSEIVHVTGSPQILLADGIAPVIYTTGTGTDTLTFSYLIGNSDNTGDLSYIDASSLVLSGGTINDPAGNAATLTLPVPGNPGSLSASKNIVIDNSAATVLNVTSDKPDGVYKDGEGNINILVQFSEIVNVTGTPTMELADGLLLINYFSGSGTDTLTFDYFVGPAHNTSDLSYLNGNSLSLNGGTINNTGGNPANLSLPLPGNTGSLSLNKNIVIDNIAPSVHLTYVPAGPVPAGNLQITATYSEPVSGTPLIDIDQPGATDITAAPMTDSGDQTIWTYNYTVNVDDGDSYVDGVAYVFLAGVADAAGHTAQPPTGETFEIATSNVIVTNVFSDTSDGAYRNGSPDVTIKITFSEAVDVTGTPRINLADGIGYVPYSSGSGSSELVFTYTIGTGDNSPSLEYTDVNALDLNGGTINDLGGAPAILTLPTPGLTGSLSFNTNIVIDNVPPTVLNVNSPTINNAYRSGDPNIPIDVLFSETVEVLAGTPTLSLEVDAGYGFYAFGSGTNNLNFDYFILAQDNTSDLSYIDSSSLHLNGSAIQDPAGNPANLSLPAPGNSNSLSFNKDIIIDNIAPSVNLTYNPPGPAVAGNLQITATYSEPVTSGTPQITIDQPGSADVIDAAMTDGGAQTVWTYNYTVTVEDGSSYVDGTTWVFLSTVTDPAGNNASNPTGESFEILTVNAAVANVYSTTLDGAYRSGDPNVEICVEFNKTVNVTGTPQLVLGDGIGAVNYVSGSGTNVLSFEYAIGGSHNAADLRYANTGSLTLNGGTINNTAGTPADLLLPLPGTNGSLDFNANIVIDNIAPTVQAVTSLTANGTYKAGDPDINIRIQFSEPVDVTNIPTLALDDGISSINYTTGSGTAVIEFTYAITPGDNSPDLAYPTVNSLSVAGAQIADAAGNLAVLTLPLPGGPGSLDFNKNIAIDTTPPVLQATSIVVNTLNKPNRVTLVYNENLSATAANTAANWTVKNNGESIIYTVSSASLQPDGVTVFLTIGPIDSADTSSYITNADATAHIKVIPDIAITDLVGNPDSGNPVTETGASHTLDLASPTVNASSIVVDNSAQPNTVSVTMNERITKDPAENFSNWTLANNSSAIIYTLDSAVLQANGTTVLLTLAAVDPSDNKTYITNADATAHIKVTPLPANSDLAGNAYAAGVVFESGASHTLDSIAPTVSTTLVQLSLTEYRLTFSEAMDKTSTESVANYGLGGTGSGGTAITSAVLQSSGNEVIITLSPAPTLSPLDTIEITTTISILDVAGNASMADTAIYTEPMP